MARVHFHRDANHGFEFCVDRDDYYPTDWDPWQGFRRYLLGIAQRRAGEICGEDRSDIVQQTLLDAQHQHAAGKAPAEPHHYRRWLRKILCCNLADAARQSGRQKRDVRREVRFASDDDEARTERLLAVDQVIADQTSPSQQSVRAERELAVQQAIRKLPANYRRVIHLKFFENRRIAEIASELEMTKAAVAGVLFRGMRKLEAELSKHGITVE